MPWIATKIPVKPTSGNYYWIYKKDYTLTTSDDVAHVAEIHVTVLVKDINKTTKHFGEFHVKFDVKTSSELRIFFYFKESNGNAVLNTSMGTKEADAKKKKVMSGEYSELKAKAIQVAADFAKKVKV